ncbi:MAG: FHA domain-containing protein [Verrucomicrobia bacterium]|nr:FHA domain-containing protein [Verrucomicrobiota bacterium]
MAKLVLLSEGLTGSSFELKAEKTTVGRLEDNAFQIPEPSVSSHHCEILLRGTEVVVKDLNSTNGTFVGGEKTTETVLKHGQILRLGQVEMRLETPEGAAAAKKMPLDQTRAIPRGVKVNELEQGRAPVFDKNSPFAKKSNKTTIIFLSIGGVLIVIIIVFVVIALQKLK